MRTFETTEREAEEAEAHYRARSREASESKPPHQNTNQPAYLRGISAAALMTIEFPPINYVVPGLVAEGATLFAGKPKAGKSWMVLDFALSIAAGRPVFGSIPIVQGDVLYLALEDSERRLKSRMLKMGVRQRPSG